jgi:hypothetical protein
MTIEVPSWTLTELDLMRVGLAFVALKSLMGMQTLRPTGTPPYPMGVARFVPLGWAASRSVARWMQYCAYVAALCYVADLLVTVALLLLTAVLVIEVTFRSSYGSVNHGDHLVAIVLMAQSAATVLWNAAERWSWDLGSLMADSQAATAAWWSVQAIVAVYFTSGLSKLINTRGRWISRSPMLLLSSYARVDTDRMMGEGSWGESGGSASLVSWLFTRPTITQCVFAGGLFVELVAPAGLYGETALLVMGLALIALHAANGLLLGLPFREWQLLVLVFLVNVPQIFR